MVLAAGGYPDTRAQRRRDRRAWIDAAKLPGKVFHAGTALDEQAASSPTAAACCARWAWATTVREAQREAYVLADSIHWNGVQYRRDIGYRAVAARACDGVREASRSASARVAARG